IAVGVKNSTSNLLIANCDEFIFYDDLVREQKKKPARRAEKKPARGRSKAAAPGAVGETAAETAADAPAEASATAPPAEEKDRKQEAFDLVLATTEALAGERG